MCWVKFSKKLSFSESLHSPCSEFVSFFPFFHLVSELFKRLRTPCMFFFLLLFSVLLFLHHYPTALFCACKCFLNGFLSSLSGWMSLLLPVGWVYLFRGNWCVDEWGNEVHPHLAAPLSKRQAHSSWAPAWAVPRCRLLNTGQNHAFIPRWKNTIVRAGTSMRRLQHEVVCVCVRRVKTVLSCWGALSWVLVCLAACVCISDFLCVFVSASISAWVAVQWSSRRTFGSHSPLLASNCPWCPAELPNDVTYTSLICLVRVAVTVWCFSLYMPFAASYPVKFNCTALTVATVRGTPSLCVFILSKFTFSYMLRNAKENNSTKFFIYSRLHLSGFAFDSSTTKVELWMSSWSLKRRSLDVCGCPQVFNRYYAEIVLLLSG